MKLLIKQRVFSWTDSYDVYDENGDAKYFVKAEFFALGHQLHVYDRDQNEIGVIKQRLLTLLPAFDIEMNGRVIGSMRRSLRFCFRNTRWTITAGVWREISWAGIMTCMTAAARHAIFPRNFFTGATPM